MEKNIIISSSCRFQTSPYICIYSKTTDYLTTEYGVSLYETTDYETTKYDYETTDYETTDYEEATDKTIERGWEWEDKGMPGMGIDVLTTTTTTTGRMLLSAPAPDGGKGSENILSIGLGTGG